MDENEITYKILRKIQQQEKNLPLPSKIDENFYQKCSDYLNNLQKISDQENNSQRIQLFKDEIQNTKKIVLNIYELREKKIVQAALSHVRGGEPDLDHLLDKERTLFDDLSKKIIATRSEMMQQKVEKNDAAPPEPKVEEKKNKTSTTTVFHVKQDIPRFVGTDMKTYSLRKDDVITLPQELSNPLQKKGMIKQIKK